MRQWLVNPKFLCVKHLNGEHLEGHMFLGCIKKGTSLKGYIEKGSVEIQKIQERHDELALEMLSRVYKHSSPLNSENLLWTEGNVDIIENIEELKRRCPECRRRIENGG